LRWAVLRRLQILDSAARMPGMATYTRLKTQNGDARVRASVRLKGYPHLHATFGTMEAARQWAAAKEADMLNGRHVDMAPKVAAKFTLRELIARYKEKHLPYAVRVEVMKQSTVDSVVTPKLRVLEEMFGDETLRSLAQGAERVRRALVIERKLKGATINGYVGLLSSMYRFAMEERLAPDNPWGELKLERTTKRVRYLREERGELARLLDACRMVMRLAEDDDARFLVPAVLVAIGTGGRKMEVFDLEWTDIDWDAKTVTFRYIPGVRTIKGKKTRAVPVSDDTMAVFQSLRFISRSKRFVFGTSEETHLEQASLRWYFERAVKLSGIDKEEKFVWHDLRHTFGSYLAIARATAKEIKELMGHASITTTDRYMHLSPEHLRVAMVDMSVIVSRQLDPAMLRAVS
jgi:integrase